MIYHSTRNEQLTASSTHAVLQGIAPDGGLYICDPAALRFDWRAALERTPSPWRRISSTPCCRTFRTWTGWSATATPASSPRPT